MIQVEICTPSRTSAEAARRGGAQRIELCRDLACGGLTPTDEDIEYCVHTLGLRTHVLVRPRPGNFYYTADEVDAMLATIEQCRRLGAAAVVVGFLDYEGRVDTALTRRAVEAADGMEVTFHRAFDEAHQDPLEALEAIIDCGCHRLLTSGQAPTALAGADVIGRLVRHAERLTAGAGRFRILAGSGVTPANARELVERTGVAEVHGSCKTTLADGTVQTSEAAVRQLMALAATL
ncbi:MAG: copper homeostasis protein CutC [Bacteroidales bacterium]|nr:copper homeostasis protein CutC [Bacteroidales bacterium]